MADSVKKKDYCYKCSKTHCNVSCFLVYALIIFLWTICNTPKKKPTKNPKEEITRGIFATI